MSKVYPPELKKYLDKKIKVTLNCNRIITGILRGFDPFMNIVLEKTFEICNQRLPKDIGMVVVRGNSVVVIEPLDRI